MMDGDAFLLADESDAERLSALANHPQIRPTCGGDGKSLLDYTAYCANPKNHTRLWEHGALLFHWSAPQTYEVHVMVRPEGRGKEAYRQVLLGVEYMVGIGAERLWARVEKGFNALHHYAAQSGFEKCGTDILDIGFGPVIYDLYQWKKPCPQR